MSLTLSDFFNTRTEQETLESVVILPFEARNASTGSFQLPAGFEWSDFEYAEMGMGIDTNTRVYSNTIIPKYFLDGASDVIGLDWSNQGADYGMQLTREGDSSGSWRTYASSSTAKCSPLFITGYRRRISSVGIDELMSAMSLPNLCANADLSINQRNFDGNWAGLAIGVYGYDQWMKVSDTHMGYVIEEGFYKPNSKYTVTKGDAVAGEFISPASGHFAVSVPFATSGKFDIYMGQFKRPWHPVQDGVSKCHRHYLVIPDSMESGSVYASGYAGMSGASFPVDMRKVGSANFTTLASYPADGWSEMTQRVYLTNAGVSRVVRNTGLSVGAGLYLRSKITVDATITLAELGSNIITI